jgi:hypothetical protein
MVGQLHRIDGPNFDTESLQNKHRGGIADMSVRHMGLDREQIHFENMRRRQRRGQPNLVIETIFPGE